MCNIAFRNVKVFFRDRAAVLYSLLAVFIIIGLYVLFLGNVMLPEGVVGGRFLMDSWIMAGMIAAGTFTTALGGLGQIIEDEDRKISKDFRSSPLSRISVTGGYVLSAILVGMGLSLVTLLLAEGYIVLNGGELLPWQAALKLLAVILLSVLASSAMMFFVVSFVRSSNAFAGLSTVAGTLIGFITGVYLPIGQMPAAVQTAMKFFPTTHAAALMRQIMVEQPLAASFAGAPAAVRGAMEAELGIRLYAGNAVIPPWAHIAVLCATVAVFFGLSVVRVAGKREG